MRKRCILDIACTCWLLWIPGQLIKILQITFYKLFCIFEKQMEKTGEHILILFSTGHSSLLWIPGLYFWWVEASQPQVWGHGPLCKVFPDPASGGQPSRGRSPNCWGRQERLEGCTRGLGSSTCGSLRLYSSWLERLQGKKDYREWMKVR